MFVRRCFFFLLVLSLSGTAYSQPPADSSLVLYLPFHAGARDASRWQHPVIVHSAAYGPDRFGQADGAFYCNGADALLEIPPAPALDLPRSLTLAVWVKLDESMTGNELALMAQQRDLTRIAMKLEIGGASLHFYVHGETQGLSDIGYFIIPSPGYWYHCAVTWDAEKKEFGIFVNGKSVGKKPGPEQRLTLPDFPICVGYSKVNDLPAEIFKGWLDDLRIYNRVLNDTEVLALTEGYAFPAEASTYQKTNQLEPGRYIIAPASANQDTLFSSIRLVEVHTTEPVWKKSWFILLIVTAVAAFSLLGAWFFFRQRQMEQALEFEKIRALEAERFRIAREMHEDIGTGLSALNLLTDMALHKNLSPELAAEIEHIAASSRKVSGRIREIVWTIDNRYDSLEQLVGYFQEYAADFFHASGLTMSVVVPPHLPARLLPGNTRRMIFLAFKESLNNILKHARATRVDIEFAFPSKYLEIYIHDNGRGFDPATTGDGGNGLTNMHKRMEEMGGQFRLESGGTGTSVTFHLPL